MDREQFLDLVEERRKALGYSMAELSERAFGSRKVTAVQDLKRGSSPSLERMVALCDALGLEFYVGPHRSSGSSEAAPSERFAMVARFDANAAAGDGHINFDAPPIDHLPFTRDWLLQNGIRSEDCVLITARGESMAPGIQDRDLVMINRRRKELTSGGIFVYNDANNGTRIKRIEIVPQTAIILRSDNPDQKQFPPEYHTGEAMNAISRNVVGQVVWSGHTWR